MIYLYTTKDKADDGCHEVGNGAWGRPFHDCDIASALASGWVRRVDDLAAPVVKSRKPATSKGDE